MTGETITLYEAIGGDETIRRLCHRFYELMDTLPEAARCRAIHPESLAGSEAKLYDYLTGYLGGPPVYVEKYGHPRLRSRHFGAAIGPEERDEWMLCFRRAMDETIDNPKLRDIICRRSNGWLITCRTGNRLLERLDALRPLILFVSGLMGASGVALAAAASHGGDTHFLGSASTMCLAHAPVLIGLYLGYRQFRTATLAAIVLGLGTIVFAGDLVCRHYTGDRLFPFAAPLGGTLMLLGWLIVAAGAAFRTRPQ